MKYIPEYYPAFDTEEYKNLTNDEKLEIDRACKMYNQLIIDAIHKANSLFIKPYTDRNLLYSRTWGKQ